MPPLESRYVAGSARNFKLSLSHTYNTATTPMLRHQLEWSSLQLQLEGTGHGRCMREVSRSALYLGSLSSRLPLDWVVFRLVILSGDYCKVSCLTEPVQVIGQSTLPMFRALRCKHTGWNWPFTYCFADGTHMICRARAWIIGHWRRIFHGFVCLFNLCGSEPTPWHKT